MLHKSSQCPALVSHLMTQHHVSEGSQFIFFMLPRQSLHHINTDQRFTICMITKISLIQILTTGLQGF